MRKQACTGKSSYHHGDLRQALLAEAVRLIREEGENALSMRALALRAGVSRTAAYHHFKGKQDLLCAIAEQGFDRILADAKKIQLAKSEEISEQDLRRFVQNYLSFAVENSEYYDLMFGGRLWKSSEITDDLTKKAHKFFRFYVSILRDWQERGQIPGSIDPVRHAQVSMSTLHGMSRLLIDGIYVEKSTIASIGDSASRMFWRELQCG